MKVAIYARYSSENQREASIADQFRICQSSHSGKAGTIAGEYEDAAVSGATLLRSGFQAMMAVALSKKVDVVLAESLDRFSRDQEDTAGLFKRLAADLRISRGAVERDMIPGWSSMRPRSRSRRRARC